MERRTKIVCTLGPAVASEDAILRLVRGGAVRKQKDLVDLLRRDGFDVTQSSISRDMRELGVLKAKDRYLAPGDEVSHAEGDFGIIARFVRDWNDTLAQVTGTRPLAAGHHPIDKRLEEMQ